MDDDRSEYTYDEDGNTIWKQRSDDTGSGPHAVFSDSPQRNGKDRGNESDQSDDKSDDERTEATGSGRRSPPAKKQKKAAGARDRDAGRRSDLTPSTQFEDRRQGD